MGHHVIICNATFLFLVVDDHIFLLWNFIFLHVSLNIISGSICGSIVDINNMIILILLLKERVKISEIKSIFCVIKRKHTNADTDLLMDVFVDFVFFVIKILFFL